MIIENLENASVPVKDLKSVVKPYALTHGTVDVVNLKETRAFYEEFLGLECVYHAPPGGMLFRLGMKFHVTQALEEISVDTETVGNKTKRCTIAYGLGPAAG